MTARSQPAIRAAGLRKSGRRGGWTTTRWTGTALLGYRQRRRARHERITVDSVHVNTYRQADRSGDFSMLLRRTADDIPGGPQLLGGKGAVDCDSQRLLTVAIGVRP